MEERIIKIPVILKIMEEKCYLNDFWVYFVYFNILSFILSLIFMYWIYGKIK